MKKSKPKKEHLYVCVVCSKKQKSSKKAKCCGKNMVAQEKGSWNI